MAAGKPIVTVPEWLRLLHLYRGGCIQPVPDPGNPGEVAAYTEARRLLTAGPAPQPSSGDRVAARVVPWLFPDAEAEVEP